jgi:hypothetical protein
VKRNSNSSDKLQIRNSTAEFLIFTAQSGECGIEVRYENETIWLTQKQIAVLFDVTVPTINEHLKRIYAQGELNRETTIRKFRIVQKEGARDVSRKVDFYNLDAIISVGYRVNSVRATQFRQWATQVLRDYAIKGYVLDKKRMENGAFLDEDYFERLLEEIREIRLRANGSSTRKSPISTPPAWITTRTRQPPANFSPKCKINCISPSTAIPPPN